MTWAPVDLPRRLKSAVPRFVDFGGRLTPILGGVVTSTIMPGSRFSLELRIPSLRTEPDARRFVAALVSGKLAGVRARFLQDGFDVGAPGSFVVDGAGQAGMTLAVRGGTPGYGFRAGQFVTIVHGGRGYLHMVATSAVTGLGGSVVLTIVPPLRVKPADGAVCNVAAPTIEGSLPGNEVAWEIGTGPFTELGSIRIDEDA